MNACVDTIEPNTANNVWCLSPHNSRLEVTLILTECCSLLPLLWVRVGDCTIFCVICSNLWLWTYSVGTGCGCSGSTLCCDYVVWPSQTMRVSKPKTTFWPIELGSWDLQKWQYISLGYPSNFTSYGMLGSRMCGLTECTRIMSSLIRGALNDGSVS